MRLDRKTFFDHAREHLFGGFMSGSQVTGVSNILDEWERRDLPDMRWLAYMLATVLHETGKAMQPIREGGGDSYLKSKPYYPFYGRGLVQCTWEVNFAKFGCAAPDDMLTWPFALRAMFDGMIEGVFTGRKLGQYFNATVDDPFGARHIINGTDRAGLITGYHAAFLAAIKAATAAVVSHPITPNPVVSHDPASVIDKPASADISGVRALQEALSDLGYYRGPVDASFGPFTETAVKGFQLAHGLAVDGVVGNATRTALDAAMVVRAAAAPAVLSPGLGRIPEPPSLDPNPSAFQLKVPPAPYQPPAVQGPHLGTAAAPKQSWSQWWAGLFGKAS
jgi:putative chitinase